VVERCGESPQAARHARPCGLLGNAQAPGDRGVAELLDHPQADGLLLLASELGQRRDDRAAQLPEGRQLLDAGLLVGVQRRRLDADAAAVLPLYGEGAAGASAGLSVLFPPLALLVLGGLAWLLSGGRRRAGEKYAGLRILR
jgi:hypothetical protein